MLPGVIPPMGRTIVAKAISQTLRQAQLSSIGKRALGACFASSLPEAVKDITHPDDKVPAETVELVKKFEQYTVNTYARPNLVIARGKGCSLYDTSDREYIDFTAGIAVTALGHADEGVTDVLAKQASRLVHTSNLYHNEHAGVLAQQLVETTRQQGGNWASRVFLANSGTEANEGALKFARKWGKDVAGPEKCEFVSFTNAFHGRSMGALSATYNPKYQKPFAPLIPGFRTAPFNDVEKALECITENTCGVLVEPIQGEGGVNEATPEFLRALRKRCSETNTLLIYDEIQCGLGRTGKLWGHFHFDNDCQPDILTMAKPLANGVPIGAIMTNAKVGEMIKMGEHGTTFGGNPLASAVALHVLGRISKPSFLDAVNQKGAALKSHLEALQAKYPEVIKHVRGRGLLLGVELSSDPSPIVKMARERGLLIVTAGNNTIRIIPPLIVSEKEVHKAVARLEGAIQQFSQQK